MSRHASHASRTKRPVACVLYLRGLINIYRFAYGDARFSGAITWPDKDVHYRAGSIVAVDHLIGRTRSRESALIVGRRRFNMRAEWRFLMGCSLGCCALVKVEDHDGNGDTRRWRFTSLYAGYVNRTSYREALDRVIFPFQVSLDVGMPWSSHTKTYWMVVATNLIPVQNIE